MTIILVGDLTDVQEKAGLAAIREHTGTTDTDPFRRKVSPNYFRLSPSIIYRELLTRRDTNEIVRLAAKCVANTIAPRLHVRSIIVNQRELFGERAGIFIRELHERQSDLTLYVVDDDGNVEVKPAKVVLEQLIGQPA
jgi:hypothetical protein